MREKIARFMQGRYGVDELARFLTGFSYERDRYEACGIFSKISGEAVADGSSRRPAALSPVARRDSLLYHRTLRGGFPFRLHGFDSVGKCGAGIR